MGSRPQFVIADWHDRMIEAGEERKEAINKNLEEAQIILLLVSATFLASDYCCDVEMKRAVERHDRGEARVIPVILRPVDNWQAAPFAKLGVAPTDGRPVTSWPNRDEAFADVVAHIRKAIKTLTNGIGDPLSSREDIFVNREPEQHLFRRMIRCETQVNILLIEAESSTGKTTLLKEFWKMSDGIKRARVDFIYPNYTMGTILRKLCDQYGQKCFSLVDKQCRRFLDKHGYDVLIPT